DYSKVKAPSQQANAQQFWSMVENYIRPLTEDDLRYLQKEDDDPRSYIIPPLGRHYREVWTEEERALFGSESSNRYSKYPTPKPTWPDDVVTISPEMCAGPLTERLISSLLNDDRDKGKIEDGDVRDISGSGGDENSGPLRFDLGVNRDVESLEDRIKRELRNIGLLADGEPNFKDRQDDELCVTLRKLQADLREQHRINMARKHRLLQIAKNRMAYQEYCQVLEDTEKQIETSFSKKYMVC
ncbi:histone acetyltransferases subunit 3-domain-containing protein, partial [Paraphysoderma sedebokerense]